MQKNNSSYLYHSLKMISIKSQIKETFKTGFRTAVWPFFILSQFAHLYIFYR